MPWTKIRVLTNLRKEMVRVMDRIVALDAKPDYLNNGGGLRPRANAPVRAPPASAEGPNTPARPARRGHGSNRPMRH